MTDYCPNCFGKLDALHACDEVSSISKSNDSGAHDWHVNQNLGPFVSLAPLAGVLLDLIVPLPSSIVHSFILACIGSAIASAIWVSIKYQGKKSLRFYLFNVKNFVYTPNLLKIFGTQGKSKVMSWVAVILVSTSLQVLFFTPGNATYLSNRVTAKIDEASGANLSVTCPSMMLYFYNKRIECRVKTGILGITVPARAKLSPIWGSSQIKVSLL